MQLDKFIKLKNRKKIFTPGPSSLLKENNKCLLMLDRVHPSVPRTIRWILTTSSRSLLYR